MKEGHYFPWHFDGNEFTVSILIQEAEEGGLFEFVPDIRKPGDENLDSVKSILKGSRDRVRSLKLKPGDMLLFKGRYSLHRVTRVRGKINRIIALPSYTLHPGMMNRPGMFRTVHHPGMGGINRKDDDSDLSSLNPGHPM